MPGVWPADSLQLSLRNHLKVKGALSSQVTLPPGLPPTHGLVSTCTKANFQMQTSLKSHIYFRVPVGTGWAHYWKCRAVRPPPQPNPASLTRLLVFPEALNNKPPVDKSPSPEEHDLWYCEEKKKISNVCYNLKEI